MECKDIRHFKLVRHPGHWNISRMECKEISHSSIQKLQKNWNISRMECKESWKCYYKCRSRYIGIYPEWNVKTPNSPLLSTPALHWNISRMECKEDDWYYLNPSDGLEYIQNGM